MPKYIVTKNMGAALKNLRQQRNVKAVTLAQSINKTGAYISKLEKGDLRTIDCNDFIEIIRTMSNNETEFSEAIDMLLKDTSMEFSEEEKENEVWKLNLDYFYRILPVKEKYIILVKEKMEELHISSLELSSYINSNFDIYNDASLSKDVLDATQRNQWVFNNGNSYVLMEITPQEIDDILSGKNKTSCYAYLFCILMSLYRLDNLNKDKAYIKAKNDLYSIKIYTIKDTNEIMREADEKQKSHNLLSQRNNENLPEENRKLLSALNDFTQMVYAFSVIDINYTADKISALCQLMKKDPVITLKLIGTDLSPLNEKPHQLKKEFFLALDNLIQEYASKEIEEEKPELL